MFFFSLRILLYFIEGVVASNHLYETVPLKVEDDNISYEDPVPVGNAPLSPKDTSSTSSFIRPASKRELPDLPLEPNSDIKPENREATTPTGTLKSDASDGYLAAVPATISKLNEEL